jgi:two-component system CheB/CheR fusion protein
MSMHGDAREPGAGSILDALRTDVDDRLAATQIAVVFLDGDRCVERFTPAAAALFGLRFGDVGEPAAGLAALADDGSLATDAAEVLHTLSPREREVHLPEGDRWFVRRVLPYATTGGLVVTFTDVTQLKRADRRKNDFLAMLAHELRNPLAPVRNAAHLLERLGRPEPALAQAREIIERQVGHMTRMVDDLLDVSRIAQGKMIIRRQPLDLVALVRAVAEDHRPAIEEKGVSLHVSLPPTPARMLGDITRLTQAIGNLLHNAAKFTGAGGEVRLSLRHEAGLGAAAVVVEDTGIGIDASALPYLFEPFTQADTSFDRSGGGLGLGLALTKGIAELHGGTARIKSDGLGRGSRLTIALPVDASLPAPAEAAPEAIEAPPSSRSRVLVIEDNPDSAEMMRLLLEQDGHEVAVEGTGPEGLATARSFGPSVVLCDIGLPGMNGYDVAVAFRADPTLRAAHLVALTGYGADDDIKRALSAGFELHLTKPVHPESLERAVASLSTKG